MRRRTPSEIKAYGDGYAEAYKEFCHLLKNHDVDKAVRKMKIFVDAVVLTVETATDEPQKDCNGCKFVGTYDTEFPCANCSRKTKDYYAKDEPQTERSE